MQLHPHQNLHSMNHYFIQLICEFFLHAQYLNSIKEQIRTFTLILLTTLDFNKTKHHIHNDQSCKDLEAFIYIVQSFILCKLYLMIFFSYKDFSKNLLKNMLKISNKLYFQF
jgi:hypothetical protein